MFAVEGSEGGNSSVWHVAAAAAAAAAGTDSDRGASWGVVRWHFAVAAHDGAAPACDDAGVDAWADGVGVNHDVGAGDQGAHAISPFMTKHNEKTK